MTLEELKEKIAEKPADDAEAIHLIWEYLKEWYPDKVKKG